MFLCDVFVIGFADSFARFGVFSSRILPNALSVADANHRSVDWIGGRMGTKGLKPDWCFSCWSASLLATNLVSALEQDNIQRPAKAPRIGATRLNPIDVTNVLAAQHAKYQSGATFPGATGADTRPEDRGTGGTRGHGRRWCTLHRDASGV